MVIDYHKCLGCRRCIPYCPVGAISMQGKKAYIDMDKCVECGNCRFNGCLNGAIVQQTMIMPRAMRGVFSNVREISPNTGVPGRGTEEMKTNDVTNRFPKGKVGLACEMGRPATGTSFLDVEKIAQVVVSHGGTLETANPTAIIFEEDKPGIVRQEFRNERALSVIIEALLDPKDLPGMLLALKEAQKEIDTVFSVDVITRVDDDGTIPVDQYLKEAGIERRPTGKTCIGIGHVS